MRMIGIIPVRMGSTRFPGKPLAMIGGVPMVGRMVEIVKATERVFPYYVATPDDEIVQYCQLHGIPHIVTSGDCRSGTARVHDAMRQLSNQPDDCVMNIQGDEPLLKPESLDALAAAFNDYRTQIASLCFKPADQKYLFDPGRVKVLLGTNGVALHFARIVQTSLPIFSLIRQHIGVYAFRRDVLAQLAMMSADPDLEQRPWIRHGYNIRMVEIDYGTVPVDRPDDVAAVELELTKRAG